MHIIVLSYLLGINIRSIILLSMLETTVPERTSIQMFPMLTQRFGKIFCSNSVTRNLSVNFFLNREHLPNKLVHFFHSLILINLCVQHWI